MSNSRDLYFDFLRGAAIIMVVAIHSFPTANLSETIDLIQATLRSLMNVAVPLFLAISGYFIAQKSTEKADYLPSLKRQIFRVYLPMLFCSLPFLVYSVKKGTLFFSLIQWLSGSFSIYYFIPLIIQCYLLFPYLKKYSTPKGIAIASIFSIIWLAFFFYATKPPLRAGVPLIIFAGPIIPWAPFFMMGLFFRINGLGRGSIWPPILVSLLMLLVAMYESFYLMQQCQSLIGLGQEPGSFLLNISLVWLVFNAKCHLSFSKRKSHLFFRSISLLGLYSFGIYLIHQHIKLILLKFVTLQSSGMQWVVVTLTTLLLSLVLLAMAKKISPKYSRLLLGV